MMKRLISMFLALVMLVGTLSLASSAFAASKPARVTGVKGVLTLDRFTQKGTYKLTWKRQKGVTCYQVKVAYPDWEGSGKYQYFVTKKIKGYKKNYYKRQDAYMGEYDCANAKVRAYKKTKSGKVIYGKWSKIAQTQLKVINEIKGFKGEELQFKNNKKQFRFSWKKKADADGYQICTFIYVDENNDKTKKIDISGGDTTTFTGWLDMETHQAAIRYYKIIDGKKVYSDYSSDWLEFGLG